MHIIYQNRHFLFFFSHIPLFLCVYNILGRKQEELEGFASTEFAKGRLNTKLLCFAF